MKRKTDFQDINKRLEQEISRPATTSEKVETLAVVSVMLFAMLVAVFILA